MQPYNLQKAHFQAPLLSTKMLHCTYGTDLETLNSLIPLQTTIQLPKLPKYEKKNITPKKLRLKTPTKKFTSDTI